MIPYMLPQQQQVGSHFNPQLTRSIEETVMNLKALESCIDALRQDLAVVAQSTGNIEAAQRVLTPANLLASPLAARATMGPQASLSGIQSQVPFASPYGRINDPVESAVNPWAFSQTPYVNPAVSPWAAPSAYGQVPPFASPYSSAIGSPYGFNPYATLGSPNVTGITSPWGIQNPAISPYATMTPWASNPLTQAVTPSDVRTFPAFGNVWQQPYLQHHLRQAEVARQFANPWATSPIGQHSPFMTSRVVPPISSVYNPQTTSPLASQVAFQDPSKFTGLGHVPNIGLF